MGVIEIKRQRKQRLDTINSIGPLACWIKVSDRKPTTDDTYVCLNDKGDYIICDFYLESGFNEWIIAWLEEKHH